jgi:23S rRNA (adenine2503-C2)-methyltransferase
MNKDLKSQTLDELKNIVADFGQKSYLAKYIFSFIHQKTVSGIDDMTALPKAFRSELADAGYYISQLKTIEKLIDPDGTAKYLFELSDGGRIEAVLLDDNGRKTICISSQVGCRLGCVFCATGYLKFERNLTAGEIIDQVIAVGKDEGKINNVVFMGMGEPLDNYNEVIKAVKILSDQAGLNIGIRRQTISTCGITPGIAKLADEKIYPRLAVSLHAADDNMRKKIMPIANKYPLKNLIKELHNYQEKTGRRISFEYCMIKNLNDGISIAKQIIKLLKPLNAHVNLIEYNSHPGCDFKASESATIKAFKDVLMAAGIETIIRYRRGRSIKAACGQLGAERIKENKKIEQ